MAVFTPICHEMSKPLDSKNAKAYYDSCYSSIAPFTLLKPSEIVLYKSSDSFWIVEEICFSEVSSWSTNFFFSLGLPFSSHPLQLQGLAFHLERWLFMDFEFQRSFRQKFDCSLLLGLIFFMAHMVVMNHHHSHHHPLCCQ